MLEEQTHFQRKNHAALVKASVQQYHACNPCLTLCPPVLQSGAIHEEHWLAHNALGGGTAQKMAARDPSRGLVPWVGIAACMDTLSTCPPSRTIPPVIAPASIGVVSTVDGAAKTVETVTSSGRAFCFLPLPIATGMPTRVHINGYFELSSNRRDIWCVLHSASKALC